MEVVGQIAAHSTTSASATWFRLCVRFGLSVLAVITGAMSGTLIMSHREVPDPFSTVSDLFKGDARQVALEQGFTCKNDDYLATLTDVCTRRVTDPLYSSIDLQISDNRVEEADLSFRENALTMGDLMLLLGKPKTHLYCEALVSWPSHQYVAVIILPQSNQIDYFTPILYMTFLRKPVTYWQQALFLDITHGCFVY